MAPPRLFSKTACTRPLQWSRRTSPGTSPSGPAPGTEIGPERHPDTEGMSPWPGLHVTRHGRTSPSLVTSRHDHNMSVPARPPGSEGRCNAPPRSWSARPSPEGSTISGLCFPFGVRPSRPPGAPEPGEPGAEASRTWSYSPPKQWEHWQARVAAYSAGPFVASAGLRKWERRARVPPGSHGWRRPPFERGLRHDKQSAPPKRYK
jgi:hypothetical protein